MQKWFSVGGGEEDRQQPHPLTSSLSSSSSSSLLADWNSYTSSKPSEQSTALGVFYLDLESAVRSANSISYRVLCPAINNQTHIHTFVALCTSALVLTINLLETLVLLIFMTIDSKASCF
ncbi:hypothetical protein CsSME_00044866 [Camellia sinensis var. sinensis]